MHGMTDREGVGLGNHARDARDVLIIEYQSCLPID